MTSNSNFEKIDGGRNICDIRKALGGVKLFDGDPSKPAIVEIMSKINGGDTSIAVIVADCEDCLGVNFWPRCHVISLLIPKTFEDLE